MEKSRARVRGGPWVFMCEVSEGLGAQGKRRCRRKHSPRGEENDAGVMSSAV